jgi:hypothetical protein
LGKCAEPPWIGLGGRLKGRWIFNHRCLVQTPDGENEEKKETYIKIYKYI